MRASYSGGHVVSTRSEPPIRIRHLLAALLLASAAWYVVPRAKAAWRLQASATLFADYALCMAGPTGPALLRDDPERFWTRVRHRLVASAADERPFEPCAAAAGELSAGARIEHAHRAPVWSFVEYGSAALDPVRVTLSMSDLKLGKQHLAELARQARPFVRGGYSHLVRPSSRAFEARHPVPLPSPAAGRGLPAWRARYRSAIETERGWLLAVGSGANLSAYESLDEGLTWRVASVRSPRLSAVAGRCTDGSGDSAFRFSFSTDRTQKTVESLIGGSVVSSAPVTEAKDSVFAASCDAEALLAAVGRPGSSAVRLMLCSHQGSCREIPLPGFSGTDRQASYPLDIARVDGAIVVVVRMEAIARVASSRDDGKSWTPWTVAFDGSSQVMANPSAVPERLVVLGRRILLYAGSDRPELTYPVLVSDDLGASWRAP